MQTKLASTPDTPISFGYNCSWLAIRTTSPALVANALALRNIRACNWQVGIDHAYQGQVFVTPQLHEWVLVASTSLPDAGDARYPDTLTRWLERLGRQFSEVQYFATQRIVEYHAWARVVGGRVVRQYGYIGEQGLVVWNDGRVTGEEEALGLVFSDNPELANARFPTEDDVLKLAGAWSINPSTLEAQSFSQGLGVTGSLPAMPTVLFGLASLWQRITNWRHRQL